MGKKFSQIALSGANLGATDFVLGVTSGSVDVRYTAQQIANYVSANLATSAFANPTASVGLTAVNGSALTAMRSDAVPALDQSIAPTWTGAHTWTPTANATPLTVSNVTSTASTPVFNATQTINGAVNATGIFYNMIPGAAPPNAASLIVRFQYNSSDIFSVNRSGTGVFANQVSAGGTIATSVGNFDATSNTGAIRLGSSSDAILSRGAAATWQLGAANAASPVAQTLQAQGSRAGTDTNIGGANLTINAGQGTGTGTLSSIILQSPVAVAGGNGAQTMTTGLTIKSGSAVLANYTVATLPAAGTAGSGATAFVTDSNTTIALGLGLAVVGGGTNKVPVYSDGTNWIIG